MKPQQIQSIIEVLEKSDGTGAFAHEYVDQKGIVHKHKCSWAVGMACSFKSQLYKNKLGEGLPDWVKALHPHKQRLLCDIAVEHGQPLPESLPL